jgi:predicted DNA-binding transcriptional regulator AlpA
MSAEPIIPIRPAPDPALHNAIEAPTHDQAGIEPAVARSAKVLTEPIQVLLVDTAQAARMVGVSVATWHRLRSAGKTPAPLRLAGSVRYRLEDLKLWVSLGCCDRKSFEAHKVARNGRK